MELPLNSVTARAANAAPPEPSCELSPGYLPARRQATSPALPNTTKRTTNITESCPLPIARLLFSQPAAVERNERRKITN